MIHTLSALELRDRLEEGELTSVEIVEALFARSDGVDDAVRGYVYQYRERAMREAQQADEARRSGQELGPLHGLPITIKENIAVAGDPVTMGARRLLRQPVEEDAVVVRLAREAGAIVLGKSNVPQTLLSFETVNPIWGRSFNPWDRSRTPGGSSGGEGALIASGQSCWGVGTDIGGSIRLPAAFCGIAGIKPGVDRWSTKGCHGALVGQRSIRAQCGPMARTAADVAYLLRALDAPLHTPHDPAVAPVPIGDPGEVELSGLRVALAREDGFFPASPAQRRAVEQAAEHLAAAGAVVLDEPFEVRHGWEVMEAAYGILSADGAAMFRELLEGEEIIKQVRTLLQIAALPTAARQAAAVAARATGQKRLALVLRSLGEKTVERFWQLTAARDALRQAEHEQWQQLGLDVLLMPVFPCAPVTHDESHDFSAAASYTLRFNVLDLPAGVVPVSVIRPGEVLEEDRRVDLLTKKAARMDQGSVGLPVGVQVIGRSWREDVVLAAMMAIEAEARRRDDFPRTPVSFAGGDEGAVS